MCVHDFTKLGIRCSTYLELLGIKRSSKEERATKRYKQKYLSGIQEKYGENITNISQAKEVQLKKEKTEENNYKMIYIWENEISKKNDIELIELVTNKLKEAGYVFN